MDTIRLCENGRDDGGLHDVTGVIISTHGETVSICTLEHEASLGQFAELRVHHANSVASNRESSCHTCC